MSAPPFERISTWGEVIAAGPAVLAALEPLAVPVMSAMIAFDTWVECHDHLNHPGNLLLTTSKGRTLKANFAYIDYSWSLTHTWRTQGFKTSFVAPIYHSGFTADAGIIQEAIGVIESISDGEITRIVERIPDIFLRDSDKKVIIEGLVYRRDHLRKLLGL